MATGDEAERTNRTDRTLDVRRLESPFDRIVEELESLPEDGTLTLISAFEPEPLYAVLDARGFDHEMRRDGPEEWRVEVTRA